MNNISSEAMQKFYDMTRKDPVIEIEGRPYRLPGYEPAHEPTVTALETHTLQGIVDAVNADFEFDLDHTSHVHVLSPTQVFLETESFGPFLQRHTLVSSTAYVTKFRFGDEYNIEEFIISMLSQFIQNEDRDNLLKLASSITSTTSGTVNDTGISQHMEIKKGISMREKVEVQNPFILKPYRTFQEIEQPASEFVFRVHDDERRGITCSLHEADGAKWKVEATESIKFFFIKALPNITVIA